MHLTRRRFLAVAGAAWTAQKTHRGREALNLGAGDGRDGLLYIPTTYKEDTAIPLLVMLHGAGNTSLSVTYTFPLAEEARMLILAPDSRDERTWDVLLSGYGPDRDFIGDAVGYAFQRCNVDRRRVFLGGQSDGASYALSLGIGAGDVFSRLIAFSPGVMQPAFRTGQPKVFISHGTEDRVMPIDVTSRDIVRRLKGLGYDVTYHEFRGGHRTPDGIVREAFAWLGRSTTK